jgi:ring-1,2-phenylacetyl-CoA epoxidase subunit PaaC
MRREETYHLMHFDLWLKRLADAGGDARAHLAAALSELWADAATVFAPLAGEEELVAAGIMPEKLEGLRGRWLERVVPACRALDLPVDGADAPPDPDGRRRRTDDFVWLHGELTMVARSEEAAVW